MYKGIYIYTPILRVKQLKVQQNTYMYVDTSTADEMTWEAFALQLGLPSWNHDYLGNSVSYISKTRSCSTVSKDIE
jgi:hypothetical protein